MKSYDVTITFRIDCDENEVDVLCYVLEDAVEKTVEDEGHEVPGLVIAHVKEVK